MKSDVKLKGVIPAIITPLNKNGEIDKNSLIKQVEYLSGKGVHGFFINGTTGEGCYLSLEEKLLVFNIVKDVSKGKQFLCVACICPSTEMVLSEISKLNDFEPDFIVAVTPFYYKLNQNMIFDHFKIISENSCSPLILYNIPQCTHNVIEVDTIVELSRLNNIAGIKDSSGDFLSFLKGMSLITKKDFSWIQGYDYLFEVSLLSGAVGIVTGIGNIVIEPFLELWDAFERNNLEELKESQSKINNLMKIIEVIPDKLIGSIKAGVEIMGRSERWTRISSMAVNFSEFDTIKKNLKKLKIYR